MKKYQFKYTKDEKIHYVNIAYQNNYAKRTVVIFQSVGTQVYDYELFYKYQLGLVSYQEYKEYVNQGHGKYVFFKEFEKVNKIFVEDNFNMCFGWYLYNNKVRIDDLIATAIKEVLTAERIDEETVTFYGNSKGAYGAILVGQYFENIQRLIATYPILRPIKRYQEHAANPRMFVQLYFLTRGSEDLALFESAIVEALQKQPKRLEVLFGLFDDDTDYLLSLISEEKFTLKRGYVNTRRQTHSQYSLSIKGVPMLLLNSEKLPKYIAQLDVRSELKHEV